ncbi:uncharacterized protein [Cicer arietinum]|uniref:Protein PHOSPHATE STARVATION RESPONSE 1-like isoform X2 n=1 Tax=Cicer arietinum TaxID=3827 RepID=A0A1S2XTW7_CICAR|nr:protein PHOSPHATE STARVATION RESPONSE 1-like isoform X2 [Cicer arietinum]
MYQHWSRMFGTQWESYMGINNLVKVVESEQVNFEPIKSSPCNNIVTTTNLQTPHVSFQATEEYYDEDQIEVPDWSCFEFPKITDPPMLICQTSGDNFNSDQITNSLYSVDESLLSNSSDSHCSEEEYSNFQSGNNITFYDHFPHKHDELLRSDASKDERPLEISFQRSKSWRGSCTKSEKQSPQLYGIACVTSSNSSTRKVHKSKRRVRWTKELHEPFMMIVNHLGGPERAKPKAILDMMNSDLLSISHIKSHLQKCRSTTRFHKPLQEKSEEGHRIDGVTELQHKIQMQIEESRQLQIEIRKSISQQLKMQRNLQTLIEQERKKLKLMLDIQRKR